LSDSGMVSGGRETVMCSMVVGLLVVGAGAVISARVPSQAATASAVNPVSATASRAERGRLPRRTACCARSAAPIRLTTAGATPHGDDPALLAEATSPPP